MSALYNQKYMVISALYAKCPYESYYFECFLCKVSLLCSDLYAQSVLIIWNAVYAKCCYYVVLHIQSVHIILCNT